MGFAPEASVADKGLFLVSSKTDERGEYRAGEASCEVGVIAG